MSQIVGATHPGNRKYNEDCFVADATLGLGLVADGMGGYACGEVASALVKDTIIEAMSNCEGLRDAIVRAHSVVKKTASGDEGKKGMGSTVIAFKLKGQDYELAWVGDSRAYLWDADSAMLHQITRDHSYVETLLSSGAISHDEAVSHPNRNLITQAVGVAGEDGLEIELIQGRLGSRQQLLICSDGLVDEVLDGDIADLLSSSDSLSDAVNSLVEQAVANGGRDNVTVVLASCEGGSEQSLEPQIIRSTAANDEDGHFNEKAIAPALDMESAVGGPSSQINDNKPTSHFLHRLEALGLDPLVLGVGFLGLVVMFLLAVLFL